MDTLFSTESVHVRDRFDYWYDVACQQLLMHDSRPRCRRTFEAKLRKATLGQSVLLRDDHSGMDIWRTRRQVDRLGNDDLILCFQLKGASFLEDNGCATTLHLGDMALVDPTLPFSGGFPSCSKQLMFKTPRAGMEARLGKTRRAAYRSIKSSRGIATLLGSQLASLSAQIDHISPQCATMLENQLLDLIAVSLPPLGGTHEVSSTGSLAVLKLRTIIESRLPDPGLNPQSVAAAAGMSVRYANTLLAHQGLSIMRLVLERRLERCRAALHDPRLAHRAISDIAFGWGFSDMTHFGRRFRAAYGMLPSDYRQRRGNMHLQ
ncbi:MAG TPA: helix-turn-helix domain-containing protein [Dongiaceae bacterium]|nr:helix-turn-helix domain-containing protein [Dongiaceae bacterium]